MADQFELRARSCPTCGIEATRVLGKRGGADHHRYGLGITTTIVQCDRCTLVFPNPFPFAVEVARLYGDPEKYFEGHDEAKKVESCRVGAREVIRRAGRADIKVLDVGCGRGEMIRALAKEGVTDVVGLEIAEEMAQYARDHHNAKVVCETIEQFAAHHHEPFDAVLLSAVLEHVYEPDRFMEAVAKLTRPGSVVYIDVPNEPHLLSRVGNLLGRLKKNETCYNLSPTWPPYHVFGFNPKALRVLLEKHGLRADEMHVWAAPKIPSTGGAVDRVRATVATQINRVANAVGMSSNMSCWARRV